MTESKKSEESERQTHLVSVPVTVTIVTKLAMDIDVPKNAIGESQLMDCDVVDIQNNPDLISKVIELGTSNECASKAFDGLFSAAVRFKEYFPDVEIYITPYAGLIPEQKL